MTDEPYVPFSQRTDLTPIPPQLEIGMVSSELRRLLHYAVHKEIESARRRGVSQSYFDEDWRPVALDFHVRILRKPPDEFSNSPYDFEQLLKRFLYQAEIGPLFD